MDRFTCDTFRPFLHRPFRVRHGADAQFEAELIEADEHPNPPRPGGRRGFSLVFRGPMRPILTQATYRIEQDDLGPMDVFIVPIGPDQAGQRYQAVFN